MNLVMERRAYLNTPEIRKRLSFTLIKDCKVEYFLSRWKTNENGGLMKVQQSESFKMQGKFVGHRDENLHLELSDD